MAHERLHVVPHEDGWAVKAEKTSGTESKHSTQREAIDAAREMCRGSESDLVIHRLDGTIRNVYAYGESNNGSTDEEDNMKTARDDRKEHVEINDLVSVGSRISWGAVLAGASVALALIVALSTLVAALGLTVSDRISNTNLFYGAVICSMAITLGALFLGGYITSLATAGETKAESVMYGIVLWGTVFAILTGLTAAGANVGFNAVMRTSTNGEQVTLGQDVVRTGTGTETGDLGNKVNSGRVEQTASAAAWWTFGAIMLSMAAAVGGSIVGAGPMLFLRRFTTAGTPTGTRVPTA